MKNLDIEDAKKWLEREEPKIEFGEIHIIIRKHQGKIIEISNATVLKGKLKSDDN